MQNGKHRQYDQYVIHSSDDSTDGYCQRLKRNRIYKNIRVSPENICPRQNCASYLQQRMDPTLVRLYLMYRYHQSF